MFSNFLSIFQNISDPWAIFLAGMIPITELRAAIPFGFAFSDLSPLYIYLLAVAGNLVPILFILILIGRISRFSAAYSAWGAKFFSWLFRTSRNRWEKKYNRYGLIALTLFVAIPLPFTGAWTGSVASFLFGIRPLKALLAISLGVIMAGFLVTVITMGIFSFI